MIKKKKEEEEEEEERRRKKNKMDIFAGRFSNSDEGKRDFATSFALE